jgi:hypothetical protein
MGETIRKWHKWLKIDFKNDFSRIRSVIKDMFLQCDGNKILDYQSTIKFSRMYF